MQAKRQLINEPQETDALASASNENAPALARQTKERDKAQHELTKPKAAPATLRPLPVTGDGRKKLQVWLDGKEDFHRKLWRHGTFGVLLAIEVQTAIAVADSQGKEWLPYMFALIFIGFCTSVYGVVLYLRNMAAILLFLLGLAASATAAIVAVTITEATIWETFRDQLNSGSVTRAELSGAVLITIILAIIVGNGELVREWSVWAKSYRPSRPTPPRGIERSPVFRPAAKNNIMD